MSALRIGVIGTGRPWKSEGATGFGMAHQHVKAFKAASGTHIAALCDIVPERAQKFQSEHGGDRIYTDYRKMLREEKLDIVTVSTWPHLHAEMVIAAAEARVKAVHCEKPMALTMGESRRMLEACQRNNVQLTFNHQRRFGEPFRKAKQLVNQGAIGKLVRLEASCGNFYDWGTHWFDMMFMYNDQEPVDWVLAQVELRGHSTIFGAPLEGQGIAHFKFRNGVRGTMVAGHEAEIGAQNRLIGTDGMIEVGAPDNVNLRIWGKGDAGWKVVPTTEGLHSDEMHVRAVADLLDALRTGREPELSGRKALMATELIFGAYESARRGGRVEMPVTIEDSPLADMIARRG